MRGRNHLVIVAVLLSCFVFNFSNTTDESKSLVDVETYIKELHDPDPAVRRQAAIGIGLLKYSPAISGLIELLGDQEVNKMAAKALRTINNPRGIAAIEEYKKKVNRCNQPLLEEESPESMEANDDQEFSGIPIALMSESEKIKKNEELWSQYRSSKEAKEKAGLLSLLARLEDICIFEELGSNDQEIQWSIFNSMKYFHSGKAVNALISALQRFPSAKQMYNGKYFFFTDPALSDTLRPLLLVKDEKLLRLAMNSLMNMGESLALDTLRTMLLDNAVDSRFPMIHYELHRALSNLDARPRKDLLIDLNSSDPARRYIACRMLSSCRVIEVIAPMVSTIFDPHPKVSEKAIDVLRIWKKTRVFDRPIPPPGFNENSSIYDFETGFYLQFDAALKKMKKSPELEKLLSISNTDFEDGIFKMKLLAVLGDERLIAIGRELLKQAGADQKMISSLANIMSLAEDATLNPPLFKLLSKNITSFTNGNKNSFWILLELIEKTKDNETIPLFVNLLEKTCTTELSDNDLESDRDTLNYSTLRVLLELGDRRILPFVSNLYVQSKEQTHNIARQVLLKIDYSATKSSLMKEIHENDYLLLEDLAKAAIREKDRELSMYLVSKNPSAQLIIHMADLLPDDYLNSPATIEIIEKDIDQLFYGNEDSVTHFLSRLGHDFRWQLCKKGIMSNGSENAPTWLRNELVHGGHPGAVDLIVKALGDPELKTERKIYLIDVALETCSDGVIPVLSKLLAGRSARLCENAAKALAKIGNETAIQALFAALISDNMWTREYTTDTLISLENSKIDLTELAERQGKDILKQWQEINKFRHDAAKIKLDQPNHFTSAEKSEKIAPLVIIAENEIQQLEFDLKTKQYILKSKREAAGLRHLTIGNNHVFAANANRIFALDKNLNKKAECIIPDIAAMAPDGSLLFAAANGHMLTLDKDLKLVGKVGLEIPGDEGEWKNAHDIAVNNRCAYLIDDVSYPYYVVQVDIQHPTKPNILSKQEIADINQHLSMQFISEKDGTWNIVQNQSHMGGRFQNLLQFSLTDGQLIRRLERKMEHRSQEDPEILSVTTEIPGWAVVGFGEYLVLAKIDKPSDLAYPVPWLYLGKDMDSKHKEKAGWFGKITTNICNQGILLYITANRQLWIVRAGKLPQIVLHQTLDKPVIKLTVIPE